ncbi:TPA: hypothetical protein N0F65_007469 [Lagenidium giganteum]|uniref:Uncharacterized protein n=1 Tax=Lagenidium giganteum TaxID=4803 RepID=A0AAV2ZM01_9STRA|nr:TPA: hypothetical protein N0F65_007469 [Lagenidium giganteum]
MTRERGEKKLWDADAEKSGGKASMTVLLEWLSRDGNYDRWRGGIQTKQSICNEIVGQLHAQGLMHRGARDVRSKINDLERSFREASDWLATGGKEMLDKRGSEAMDDIRRRLNKICRYYDELAPMLQAHHTGKSVQRLATKEKEKSNDDDDDVDDEEEEEVEEEEDDRPESNATESTGSHTPQRNRETEAVMRAATNSTTNGSRMVSQLAPTPSENHDSSAHNKRKASEISEDADDDEEPSTSSSTADRQRLELETKRLQFDFETKRKRLEVETERFKLEQESIRLEQEKTRIEIQQRRVQLAKELALAKVELQKAGVPEAEIIKALSVNVL